MVNSVNDGARINDGAERNNRHHMDMQARAGAFDAAKNQTSSQTSNNDKQMEFNKGEIAAGRLQPLASANSPLSPTVDQRAKLHELKMAHDNGNMSEVYRLRQELAANGIKPPQRAA